MPFEQDYIMRMIKEMVKALASIIFNKRIEDETPENPTDVSGDSSLERLLQMADRGKINQAENLLLEQEDLEDYRYLQGAMKFYEHLNDYTDDFLEAHDYTRQEIIDGLKVLLDHFGLSGMLDLIKR